MSAAGPTHTLNARVLRFRANPEVEDGAALAEDLLAAKRYADVRAVVAAAQSGASGPSAALCVLEGRASYLEGDLERAQKAFLSAVKLDPRSAGAFSWLGTVLYARDDLERAIRAFERSLELDPTDVEPRRLLTKARAAIEQGGEGPAPAEAPAPLRPVQLARPAAEAPRATPAAFPVPPSPRGTSPMFGTAPRVGSPVPPPPSPATDRTPVPPPPLARPAMADAGPPTRATRTAVPEAAAPISTPPLLVAPSGLGPRMPAAAAPKAEAPRAPARAMSGTLESLSGPSPAELLAARRASPTAPRAPSTRRNSDPPARAPERHAETRESSGRALGNAPAATMGPLLVRSSRPAPRAEDVAGAAALATALREDAPPSAPPGVADDVDAVLATLARRGIFEPPEPVLASWLPAEQVARSGLSLRRVLIGAWVFALIATAAGYFGFRMFVEKRHTQALQLMASAESAALEGDYRRLIDAERMLAQARDLYPRSREVLRTQVLVHSQAVLETGSRELGALRIALARAKQLGVDPAYLSVARAVMAAYSADPQARAALEQAGQSASGEAKLLYLVGRLEQRLGDIEAARSRLQASLSAAPSTLAAEMALVELEQQAGHEDAARERLATFLAAHRDHVRARLWDAFLGAPTRDPAPLLAQLDSLAKLARAGTVNERILFSLARARVLGRLHRASDATDALREALAVGAGEPALLSTLAEEAHRAAQLGLAQQAATLAVTTAPGVPVYRVQLASILLERHEGDHALSVLAEVPAAWPDIALLRARAALETQDPTAMKNALAPLEAQLAVHRSDQQAQGLRLRLQAALAPDPKLLLEAKAAERRAPKSIPIVRALGEVALALRSPSDAIPAFKTLTSLTPSDPEAFLLLGRARRMGADASGAESSFRKALALAPGSAEALAQLGALQLDTGDYAGAQTSYRALLATSPIAARLGLVEALIGMHHLEEAKSELAAIPAGDRDSVAVTETSARLLIAQGSAKQAVASLESTASSLTRASTLALYADALAAAGQAKPASAAYDRALQIDAGLPEALVGKAELQLATKFEKDTISLLSRAKAELEARLRPPELRARALGLLGLATLEHGKKKEADAARALLKQALELDPHGRYASRIEHALAP